MNLRTAALDLLFPPKCPFCQRVLDEPRAPVCPVCREKLPWLTGERAERRVDFADGCVSPLAYRDGVPEAVHRYKFSRVQAYGTPFGVLVAQCLRDHWRERPDGITWAPLSKKRLRQRGFDQAELLGGEGAVPPRFSYPGESPPHRPPVGPDGRRGPAGKRPGGLPPSARRGGGRKTAGAGGRRGHLGVHVE